MEIPLLDLVSGGLLGFGPVPVILATLGMVQLTIASVTLYLHRSQAHRAVDFHPLVSHVMRFWLWLTTGMVTREWVAIHRKHHARCETSDDPHSPVVHGIRKVLWDGVSLYRQEAANAETLRRFGQGTPDDWLERRVYAAHPLLGISLLLVIDLALFGAIGLTVWAVQMLWIPFWAAGVINGLGHWWGYRNYQTPDTSTNLSPLAVWIGGEELHNNHHAFPNSARFSSRWFEFDIGWMYIRLLGVLGLAKVRTVAPPRPRIQPGKDLVDLETVRAVVVGRMHVMAGYARMVVRPVLREYLRELGGGRRAWRRLRALLTREEVLLSEGERSELARLLDRDTRLRMVYEYRARLQALWGRAASGQEAMVQALRDWCAQAEASGVQALQDFARHLRSYSLQAA